MSTGLPVPASVATVIVNHIHTDLDAFGAMVGARKLFPGAVPVLQPTLDPSVRVLAALHRDALGLKSHNEVDLSQATHAVVVDTRSASRLGTLFPPLDRPEVVWTVIDHHPPAPDELPASAGVREVRGSATSLVVEALMEQPEISVEPHEATLMALGIYADTGSLLFPGTTAADVKAVAWLLERGADLAMVARWLEEALPGAQREVLESLVGVAQPRMIRGVSALVVGGETTSFVSGLANVADKLQAVFEVDVVVLVVEMEGRRTQIVGRSRLQSVDLRAALAAFAPAGHARAASAHAKNLPFAQAVEDIWLALEMTLPPEPVAQDLMSSPVRTIEAEAPVAEAVSLLHDHGHSALVVTRNGRLAGIVSRRDLDRAARHGLRGTEVRHVMTSTVVTTEPDTPLSEILAIFVKRDIGRLPVMRQDAMLGIVTRSDVIRAQYDQAPDRREAVARKTLEMSERLQAYWPADWLEVFEQLSAAAEGKPVFLVGGAVRDLMLDRKNLDADFVVEGDAIALAEALAARVSGATCKVHPAFGTAHVYLPDGKVVDLASARTEHYERPGALPRVALSSIKQDLARRDFSINCLAIRIDRAGHGELIDFFGAQADLQHRQLRVLHNLSFIEDPTRVLRAVRFEQTLGFRMERRTEDFARFAFETGTFDGLGGERNKLELTRLLTLPRPLQALERLSELGALRLLAPGLGLDDGARQRLRRLQVALRRLAVSGEDEAWLAWLATLLFPLGAAAIRGVAERLHLAGRQIEHLNSFAAVMAESWLDNQPALQVVEKLRPLPPPLWAACYACADRPQRRLVLQFSFRWRHVQLTVSGRDLRNLGLPPGPLYSQLLNRLLALRLQGSLTSEDELSYLQSAVQEHRSPDAVQ